MTIRQKRFWKGAGMVSAEMLGAMTVFTCALAGLVFWLRPYMRRHKKIDLKIFDIVKAHTNEKNTQIMSDRKSVV